MKTTRTRICAALCAAATFLLLMPATAFAATTMTGQEFVNSAKDGAITLEDDVILTSTASIKQDMTINLNGHTLTNGTTQTLIEINSGSETLIVGPGTVTGGEQKSTSNLITVTGNSTLTARGTEKARNLTIEGFFSIDGGGDIGSTIVAGQFNGKDESFVTIENAIIAGGEFHKATANGYNRTAGDAIRFYSSGMLKVDNSVISGGNGTAAKNLTGEYVDGGQTFASGGIALNLYRGTVDVIDSVIQGGNSDLYNAGDAINFGNGTGVDLSIQNSTILGGNCIRPKGSYGIGGDAIEITQNMSASKINIASSEVKGGEGGNSWIGSGVSINRNDSEPIELTVSNSSISGGDKGSGYGNAIYAKASDPQAIQIDITDTKLSASDGAYEGSVIYNYGNNVPVAASGLIDVTNGILKNTLITPGSKGVKIIGTEPGVAIVGKNDLTVLSNAAVTHDETTTYFPTATDAIQNAKPGSTVTITNVDENENLPAPPAGVELENGTDSPILVGGQAVAPGESVASYVAKIGDKGYLSFEAALADAKAKDTIELLDGVESSEAVTVPAGVTIDGNGHAISCTSVIANGAFVTAGGDGVTLKDLVVNTNGNAKHGVQFYCVDGGTLDGVSINGGSYTSVIINGATNIDIRNCTLTPDASAYAHIEFAMGKNVNTVPSMTLQGALFKGPETAAKVWIDNSTVESIKAALGNDTTIEQVVAHIKERIDNNDAAGLDIAIQTKPDSIESIVVGGYVPPAPEHKYAVTIAPVENGTVAADPENAAAGETVVIVATPAEGFSIESIAVKDAKGALVETIAKDKNSFTFEMPASDVTVTVTFACDGGTSCPSHIFPDVDRAKWYHVAIDWAVSNKVMNGFESGDLAGLFGPEMNLTRAQMVQILWNLEGKPAATLASSFSDVSQDDWFYGAIAWAVSEGIYEGYEGSNLFGPNDSLTREQAAAVLMRWSEMQGEDASARADLSAYPDADEVSGWAVEYLSWAVGADILHGVEASDGTLLLASQSSATRAEAAMLMMRLAA